MRSAAPALLALFLLALLAPGEPAPAAGPRSGPQEREMKVARLMRTCERCHQDVWEEWSASGHSRAWTNSAFQAAIAEREDEGEACASCHAPDSVLRTGPGQLPRARSADRDLGVNCITCHMDGREYFGPVPADFHGGVTVRADYRSSTWCASCHGHPEAAPHHEHYTSYLESPAAGNEESCQSCHMPLVTRQLAKSKRPLKDLQPAQACRVHRFGTEVDAQGRLAGAAELRATFEGNELVVELEPHGGHRLAAGEWKELRLEVRFLDAAGDAIETESVVLPKEGELALEPGRTSRRTFAAPEEARAAEVSLGLDERHGDELEQLVLASTSAARP